MKKSVIVSLLVGLLSALMLVSIGCNQPGKTAAEVNREHLRMLRINQQELVRDVDKALLLDRPSRLTDMRLP